MTAASDFRRDPVSAEVGRLLGLWTTLRERLTKMRSEDPVGDLFAIGKQEDLAIIVADCIQMHSVRMVSQFENPEIAEATGESLMKQLCSVPGFDSHAELGYPNIIRELNECERSKLKPIRYELWSPRREMSVGEAHRVLKRHPGIEFCAPQELLGLCRIVPNAVRAAVFATRTLDRNTNVVLAAFGPETLRASRKLILHQTAGTQMEENSGILVRRIAS